MMKHYMLTILLTLFFRLISFAQESTTAIIDCRIGNLPVIVFKEGKYKLTKQTKLKLDSVADRMKSNPNCKVKLIGYGFWNTEECKQQLCWMQMNTVRNYLIEEEGIAENRFTWEYGKDGEPNTVSINGTLDEEPKTVPAPPHPYTKKFNRRSCEKLQRD